MIGSSIERALGIAVVALALAVGCDSKEPAGKTASADKPKAADKAKDADDKGKGGGGRDEVVEAEEPDDAAEAEQPEDELAGYDPRVVQAAAVAREIATDPATADDVLAKQNLDREKLDALMYEIASDPDLTEQYRIARGL